MPVLIILMILAAWLIVRLCGECTTRQLPPELFQDPKEREKFTMQLLRTPPKKRNKFLRDTAKNWKKK